MKTPLVVRLALVLSALLGAPFAAAQPSGGPYGPQNQTYEVPKDAAHVYYVAPDGQADAAGTLEAPTTLEAAIAKVVTRDAIILRGGTYRVGGLVLNQGVTIQPYRDEKPVLKGTQVVGKWVALRDGYWRAPWKTLFPSKPRDWWQRDREGTKTPLHRFNNDMVFVDGVALRSAGWEGELDATSYYIDYDAGQVYLRTDPTNKLVEITAWDIGLLRTSKAAHGKESDRKGYQLRGVTFTQYAYRALEVEGKRGAVPATEEPTDDPIGIADPATFGKEVVGTLIENCSVTHCSRVGGYFRGDNLVIRNCLFSDTSTEGIYVIGSSDCLLERNIVARNNVEQFTGYYPSAVKIFNQTRRVTFRDNLVIDNPNSNGVWYDVGNVDGVFVNNWVDGCGDGFFFEISKGAICAGNVFTNCNKGVRVLNSSHVRVFNNTFLNATASFERNERSAAADHFAWHPATGPDVHEREGHVFSGNVMVATASFNRPLFRAEQSPVLKGKLTSPMFTSTGNNFFVRPPGLANPLVTWSPGEGEVNQFDFKSLADLQAKLPAFEQGSRALDAVPSAVLQSPELRNLHLTSAPSIKATLPAEVAAALGWPKQDAYLPGAYQTR
jgi:parallel beta-helix repeat protein